MKNILRVFLLFILFTIGLISNGSFLAKSSDITNHWAAFQLQEWLNKGIVNGYGDGRLKPDDAITRAEFAALVNKAFGFSHEVELNYSDVSPKAWYYQEIRKAVAAGYIQGYGDGTIKPGRHITREEAATLLDRILQLENETAHEQDLHFLDRDSISRWSMTAVERITKAEYVKGYADQTFKPQKKISRAEAVVLLSKGTGEIVLKAGTYGSDKEQKIYDENVTITTGNVKLTNTVIKGDLLLAEAIKSEEIILENVVVEGRVRIAGGGSQSVYIIGTSVMKEVYVNKKMGTIRVVLRDEVQIDHMTLLSHAIIVNETLKGKLAHLYVRNGVNGETELRGNFEEIKVDTSKAGFRLIEGNIGKLTFTDNAAKSEMTMDERTFIEHLILNDSIGIFGYGHIKLVEINASGVHIELLPHNIKIEHGLKAVIGGKDYPPAFEKHSQSGNGNAPNGGSSRDDDGSNSGGNESKVSVTGITLDRSNLTLKVGETATLNATVLPASATNQSVIWSSDDDSVAEVNAGIVVAKSAGVATITATSVDGGFTSTSQITVINPVTGITLDRSNLTLKVGETATLNATLIPANATNQSVIWNSDDDSVAEVNAGIVTAKSLGEGTITATTVDGGFTASSQIYVGNGRADVVISTADIPVIQQYPFAVSIRNAYDEMETKIDGSKQVTVTVKNGENLIKIFDDTVLFKQGDASVTPLSIAESGTYQFIITIEGIRDQMVIPNIEVVLILESVLRAKTNDEIYRSLLALGMLYPKEFDSDSIEMINLQAYMDDFSVSKPLTVAAVQVRVNEVNDLLTAPQFVIGFPEIDKLQDIWFNFRIMLDKKGIVHYLVVEDGAVPPTVEEVKNGEYNGAAPIASGSKSLDLGSYGWGTATGLAAETEYNLYMVAESDSGALSAHPIMLNVTTIPYIPAAFVDEYPQIDELSDNHFSLKMQATKDGTMHYLLVPRGSSVPTSEQVKSRSYPGVVTRSGSVVLPMNSVRYTYIRNLPPNFEFDLYAVIEDTVIDTLQPDPTKLQITTLPDQAPLIVSGPRILSSTENAFKFWLFLNKIGKIYYMLVEENAMPPTSQEVQAGAPYGNVIPTKSGASNLSTTFTIDIVGLSTDTEYVLYIVTESQGNSLSDQPTSIAVKTLPYQPAQFTSNNPYTNHEQVDKFHLGMNLTKPGIVHYLVVHKDSDAPNAEQVLEGKTYGGVTVAATGSIAANPNASEFVEGLYPNTEYDIYLVVEDAVVGLQAPVKLQAATIADSPPGYWDSPNVFDVSDSSLKLQMGIIRPGYGYYLLQRAGELTPTSQQVKDNPTDVIDLTHVGGGAWIPINNLLPDTNYEIFVVVESIYGALQAEPIKLVFKTLEETEPPVFTSNSPLTLDVTSNSFYLYYQLDKPGTVHYIVVDRDAREPTADQVVIGESYDGIPIIRRGYADYVISSVFPSFYFNNLTPDTTYVVYIVGKGIGNKTTPVHRVEITTSP